jgi:hypothetical protein
MIFSTRNFLPAFLALLLVACGDQRPVPALEMTSPPPAVVAEFRTTVKPPRGEPSQIQWRFWRTENRIERENPAGQSGDLWVRDGQTLFHTRLYHADRRGIEYRSDDLQMLNASPEWTALATLLDPDLIQSLREEASGWRNGYPYRRYTGEIDAVRWDITVRTDQMLPVRIERRSASRQTETVELLRSYPVASSPWQPTPSGTYDILDYADLGDHERDPFVMRVQAAEGGGHLHGHAH